MSKVDYLQKKKKKKCVYIEDSLNLKSTKFKY